MKPVRLRSLLIASAVVPFLLSVGILHYRGYDDHIRREEDKAIADLREMAAVMPRFRENDLDHDNILDYPENLDELGQYDLVGRRLVRNEGRSYVFYLSGSTFDWIVRATPRSSRTGWRHFAIPTDGVLRIGSGEPASTSCPTIQWEPSMR